jgi:CubicO group peptidase (beta-lactamase class C family)
MTQIINDVFVAVSELGRVVLEQLGRAATWPWPMGNLNSRRLPSPGVSYPWAASAGSCGWPGVYGTGWYNDPAEDMTTILMIQRVPAPPSLPILPDFWTAAYQAIDD